MKVARALAEDALERLRNAKQPAEYNSADVANMVGHNVAPEDATRWLASVWAKLKRRLDEREARMQDTGRRAGLYFYAWPRKTASSGGAGNSSTYSISFLPVPQAKGQAEDLPSNGIAYVRDVTLRPAFWVRPLLEAGFALRGCRRNLFVAYGLGGMVIVGCILLVLWLIVTTQAARLPSGQLFTLLLLAC